MPSARAARVTLPSWRRSASLTWRASTSARALALLVVGHVLGTLASGGAFESPFVQLCHLRGSEVAGVDVFELDDLEAARARFEALGKEASKESQRDA